MSKVTIAIEDAEGEVNITGAVDPVSALEGPPTGALIIGSYVAAHIATIFDDAVAWYANQVTAAATPTIETPSIILPGDADA